MAACTKTYPAHTSQDVAVCLWVLTSADPVGEGVYLGNYADRSAQLEGAFGGGTVVWEGSLNGTDFHTLTNLQGQLLSHGASALEPVAEMTVFTRPRLVGGAGATVTATLAALRTAR
ncbi:MAG: hypothetical protein RLZZ524_455 [Pseudomonadota bacterium]